MVPPATGADGRLSADSLLGWALAAASRLDESNLQWATE